MNDSRERMLSKGEYLAREGTPMNFAYLLLEGSLRVEKEVEVKSLNKWPAVANNETFTNTKHVRSKVVYTVHEL